MVSANIEPALKELKKLMPKIKQQVEQTVETAQKAMEQIDMKKVTTKIQQSVQLVKKKMEDLKKSNKNNEIALTVNNKEAQKQISQIEKQISSLQEKINARQLKLDIIEPQIDQIIQQTRQDVAPKGVNPNSKSLDKSVDTALFKNKEFASLSSQAQKLGLDIQIFNKELENAKSNLEQAKSKMGELEQETSQTGTSQNKLTGFFSAFKGKLEQAKGTIGSLKGHFNQLPKITQKVTSNIKKMSSGMKQGLGHVLKYAAALFSLRSIYSTLSSSASSWLSSQNAQAQQLSANIEYMRYSMGSVFAPVIEYITNLVYNLMKAIQSLVYAFSGINIFAKATASSMNSTANSAKQANKSLSSVHSEINNVSDNNSGSGSGSVSPSMDLTQVDGQMNSFAQKLYDFFKPLVDSWNTYGNGLIEQVKTTAGQIGGLIASVWGSFENIITNGTVYSILENILAIIGNIAEAFSNAWNYNGNGDAIVQSIANAFNNLLIAINNVVQSEGFQNFLNWCSDKFREIAEKIESIDWQPLMDTLSKVGTTIGKIALEILDGLIEVFKWIVEHPIVVEILIAIAIAIGIVSTAMGILNAIMYASPITWIMLAIVAVIAIIILLASHWEEVWNSAKTTLQNAWNGIKYILDIFKSTWEWVWNGICSFFTDLWNHIVQVVTDNINNVKNTISNVINTIKSTWEFVWNGVCSFFSNLWNTIVTIVTNCINNTKNTISNILNGIKTIWDNIWNGLKTTVTNIFNGIWNCIKGVINSILGGIEGMANGVVNGINFVIKALNKIHFDIPDWIPGLGGKSFGFSIGLIPQVSLPRLAKGNVAYSPLVAQFGEYAGASTNPEITAPQNILKETFDEVLSKHEFGSDNKQPIRVQIYWGTKTVVDEIIDGINEKTRQTGKAQIKVAYN